MNGMKGIFGKGWLATGLLLLATAFFALAGPTPGAADGAIPIYQAGTISAPGVYYLTQDMTTGAGITITANDVTLDLNGHTLTSSGDGVNCTGYSNIRVTNGRISAISVGIYFSLPDGGFAQIDHVTVAGSGSWGIDVVSSAGTARAVVNDNTILRVTNGQGIILSGVGRGQVCGNVVTGATRGSGTDGIGIYLSQSRGNIVSDNVVTYNGWYGLYLSNSDGNQIMRNNLSYNGNSGIYVIGYANSFTWNTVTVNTGYAMEFVTPSGGNVYANNHVPSNTSGTITAASGNTNGGGNFP